MNMEVHFHSTYYYIISIQEKDLWDKYIQRSAVYDFYHSWYYHSLETSGDPFLFVFEKGEKFVALPLIKREIENTPFFDCTSAYGYVGPVSNVSFEELDKAFLLDFKQSFLNFVESENIISVFSRLHPIINQDLLLNSLGGIYNNGRTVAVDLNLTVDQIRLKYRRSIRQKVNQLRKKGFVVKETNNKEEILEFIKLYNDNMIKVKASSYYFFNEKYFFDLMGADDFESKLLLAYYEDKIAGGGIVTFSNNIMQFHLAATNNDFLTEAPMKLLFDEASVIGKNMGMRYLHLGGGVGGREDSLFNFKCGFSDLFMNFNTWRYIANLSIYNNLVEERCKNTDFNTMKFPLYRS